MTREERLSQIKATAAATGSFLDAMARQLLALSHPQAEEAEVLERLEKAFRAELPLLNRIALLAELAPQTVRAGREYGAMVQEISH